MRGARQWKPERIHEFQWIAGGRSVPVAWRDENGFRLDPADLEAAITPRTRWLLLNSPANTSGAAYSAAHCAGLQGAAMKSAAP